MRKDKLTFSSLVSLLIYLYIFIVMTNVSTGAPAVKVIRVVLAAMLALYALRSRKIWFSKYIKWALVFQAYNVVTTQFALNKSYAVSYTATLFYVLIINAGICIFMAKHDITDGMMKAFIFSTIVEAFLTFSQYGLLVFMDTRRTEEGSANTLGFYAAMAFIFGLIMYKKKERKNQKYFYLAASVLCLAVSLLTASRKVLVYIFIPLVVYWISNSKNPAKTFRNIVLAAAVVGLSYYAMMHVEFAYNLIGRRIQSMISGFMGEATDSSTSTRLRLISNGLAWFRIKPWFGYGLSNFSAMNLMYNGSVYYAHNNYVELLVDCGIVGTILYYFIYVLIFSETAKNKTLHRNAKSMLIGLLVCFLVGDYGMVSYNHAIFQLILMNLFVLSVSAANSEQTEKQLTAASQITTGGSL